MSKRFVKLHFPLPKPGTVDSEGNMYSKDCVVNLPKNIPLVDRRNGKEEILAVVDLIQDGSYTYINVPQDVYEKIMKDEKLTKGLSISQYFTEQL